MRKRLYLLIAAMLLAAFALGMWEATRQREPVYLGKALSQWLEEVPDNWGYPLESCVDPEKKPVAAKAVRAMGTNALPALISMMEAQDSPLEERLLWLASYLRLIDVMRHTTRAERRHAWAFFGFCALGTNANPAVPALTDLFLRRGEKRAATALAYMSPEGVLALSQVLTNRDIIRTNNVPQARFTAFCELMDLAWVARMTDASPERSAGLELHARLAEPCLLQCLNDADANIRITAAEHAADLGVDRDKALTVFTNCLADPNPVISKRAALDLSALGPAATSAVLPLVNASQVLETSIRSAVTNALQKR